MKIARILSIAAALLSFFLSGCGFLSSIGLYRPPPTLPELTAEFRKEVVARKFSFEVPARTRVDSIHVDSTKKVVEIRFNDAFSNIPYRPKNVQAIYRDIESYFTEYFPGYNFRVTTLRRPIEDLIPNYFRSDTSQYDRSRMPLPDSLRPLPVVRNISRPFVPSKGLYGRNIGLWHSHGWYYNKDLDRWEWQRPRLFLSVEDLIPMSFTIPYLIPMLENAGAQVFVPRERDVQTNEVVVDNDSPGTGYSESAHRGMRWGNAAEPGFGIGMPPYGSGVNPFRQGSSRVVQTDTGATATATWVPDIPQRGSYSVSVSYHSTDTSVTDAHYIVHHLGGITDFSVDQKIGDRTWIYLGTFEFAAGNHPETGSVTLTNETHSDGRAVTADAVRFGGGMGVIARNGKSSGRPKFVEGSRYYLQYAGMPDSLVFNFSRDENDYRDDYMSRPEYLNYLKGAPYGPNANREERGLGIPIDLSMAFHTDAGITNTDTTIGTLSIYSIPDAKRSAVFPDSVSRLANRDLADLVQTQVVADIREQLHPAWQRRQLMNSNYAEAVRPNMPSLLLELLSHQNYLDMKFFLDPRFRFIVARSIYKGMLRFLATEYDVPYIVEPLPVTHMVARLGSDGSVTLQWKSRADSIEPTAKPVRYVVYTRTGNGGFDNGFLVDSTTAVIRNIPSGVVLSFKVTAVNEGGESFPSEILSVCRQPDGRLPVLIVNGFHRIGPPEEVDAKGFEGFLSGLDRGVPDRFELGFTGEQFDFDRTSPYRSNDGPGHGASFADNEGKVIAGNSFDYPSIHGEALKECGFSFSSASSEAVMDSMITLGDFRFVDIILGKEKETHWPTSAGDSLGHVQFRTFPFALQSFIEQYCSRGGNLLLSGAYVGTDLFAHPDQDSTSIRFAWNVLRTDWSVGHASRNGSVYSTNATIYPKDKPLSFNVTLNPRIYGVESPDAIVPRGGSHQLLRYSENQFGAAVGYRKEYGMVVMGFPFETITGAAERVELMQGVLHYLGVKPQ